MNKIRFEKQDLNCCEDAARHFGFRARGNLFHVARALLAQPSRLKFFGSLRFYFC